MIERFLNYLSNEGDSPLTIKNYRIDLTRFMDDCGGDYDGRTLEDISNYIGRLRKSGNGKSDSTVARNVSVIKSFYKWVAMNNLGKDIGYYVKVPKITKKQPVFLELNEANELLDLPKSTRDEVIISILLNCGLRVSELATLEFDNIKQDKMKFIGKGKKERTVYLNDRVRKDIDNYIKDRPQTDSKKFLISRLNKGMTAESVGDVVNKYSTVTAHKLRHTCATLMLEGGSDIRSIQETLGHVSLTSTQIYTHVSDKRGQESVNMNPLAKEEML